jgi:3-oxoacyl-[acyl-carrier protein] reductase
MSRDLVLITGASSDIGIALIRSLLAGGDRPEILAHCKSGAERIEELRKELGQESIVPLVADFNSLDALASMAGRIAREHGVPNKFVHLPGLKLVYERFTKFSWEHFERDLNIQVRAAVILLKEFMPQMAKMPSAHIVFLLSSVTRGVPPKYLSMYTIVKLAQLGLMRALASEYASTGVSVNAISPGMVETRFLDNIPVVAKQMAASATPRGRNATPDDVVGAMMFLLSSKANYITGIELPVAGGAVY